MPTRYVDKLGVELEGAWANPPESMYGDGSVNVQLNQSEGNFRQGEVNSVPLSLIGIQNWVRKNYPTKANNTCGMHVHMSFKNNHDYIKLMDKKFHAYFLECMEKFGKHYPIKNKHYWDRLEGRNTYCKNEFKPETQCYAKNKGNNRYTQLNFCHALHGTLECRLFPVFKDCDVAIAALKSLVTCVETYLGQHASDLDDYERLTIFINDETEVSSIKTSKEKS